MGVHQRVQGHRRNLDTQPFPTAPVDMGGVELPALDLTQHGLTGSAEGGGGLVGRHPAVGNSGDDLCRQRLQVDAPRRPGGELLTDHEAVGLRSNVRGLFREEPGWGLLVGHQRGPERTVDSVAEGRIEPLWRARGASLSVVLSAQYGQASGPSRVARFRHHEHSLHRVSHLSRAVWLVVLGGSMLSRRSTHSEGGRCRCRT